LAWGDKRSMLLDKYILFPLLKLSNCIQKLIIPVGFAK